MMCFAHAPPHSSLVPVVVSTFVVVMVSVVVTCTCVQAAVQFQCSMHARFLLFGETLTAAWSSTFLFCFYSPPFSFAGGSSLAPGGTIYLNAGSTSDSVAAGKIQMRGKVVEVHDQIVGRRQ